MNKVFKKQKIYRIISKIIILFSLVLLSITSFLFAPVVKNSQFAKANVYYQANEKDSETSNSSSQANKIISYPLKIAFALAPITTIIPDSLEGLDFPREFYNFSRKLLNNSEWTELDSEQTQDYTNALLEIFRWYHQKILAPTYLGSFPDDARNLLSNVIGEETSQNLNDQFHKINGIPETPEELEQISFKYIYPEVTNVLDSSYGSAPKAFPELNSFDYKMFSLDLSKLENAKDFIELEYQYKNQPKYRIFINNKNDLLKKDDVQISELLKNGNILIRDTEKKHPSKITSNNFNNSNIVITKTSNKIEFYTSIKQEIDFAILRVNRLTENWKIATKVGLLESPLSPKNVLDAIDNGRIYTFVPSDGNINIFPHAEKSDYIAKLGAIIPEEKTFSITFYMAIDEKITLPVFYQNKRISGAATITLSSKEGELKTNTLSLKIPGSDYQDNIAPIEIKHRKQTIDDKIWIEVKITTDNNIIVGSKDPILSRPEKVRRGVFDLQKYNANQKHIIFEKPDNFTNPYQEIKINYSKIFDSASETAKMIGETYYSAWGVYTTPKFIITNNLQAIEVAEVIEPQFVANKLTYLPTKVRRFLASQKPTDQKIVQNNFGILIEDINNYANQLNKVIKKITDENLFLGDGNDYLKPSMEKMQPQKFASDVLMTKNKNEIVKKAFDEIQIATQIFVNGKQALDDYEDEPLPDKINFVKKGDRKLWLAFAIGRIKTIVKNRYKTLLSDFQKAIFNFKYTIINQLLEANSSNYTSSFNGINKNLITKLPMLIGTKKQEMMKLTDSDQKLKKYSTFKQQLTSLLKALERHPIITKILSAQQVPTFNKQVKTLLATKSQRDNEKTIIVQTANHLFKIIDHFANLKNGSLVAILTINDHIKDPKKRLEKLVNIFNIATKNFIKSQRLTLVAYAMQTIVNSRQIDVAINNVQKTFDSFLAKPNLSTKAVATIKNFKNYDYWSNPNKLAEIAIKIREYDLNKFFNDLTKDDIGRVTKKILKLNPLLELPGKLPPQSQFVDIIKHTSQKTNISFAIIGLAAMLIMIFITAIGYRNRKILTLSSKILICISLLSVAVFIITIGFMLPVAALPIGA